MAKETVNINIKLYTDKETDNEIIDFLEGKPRTYIIKEALKMYKNVYENMGNPSVTTEQPQKDPKLSKFAKADQK